MAPRLRNRQHLWVFLVGVGVAVIVVVVILVFFCYFCGFQDGRKRSGLRKWEHPERAQKHQFSLHVRPCWTLLYALAW